MLLTDILLVVVFVMAILVVWAVLMQRIAIARQKQALITQNEAVERQKQSMTLAQESLELSRASVANQQRIIQILEEIRDHERAG